MRERKRVFIGLQVAGLVLIAVGALLLIGLYRSERYAWSAGVVYTLAVAGFLFTAFIAAGIVGLVICILRGHVHPTVWFPVRMAVDLLFPVTLLLARIFRLDKRRVERSFIEVKNQLARDRDLEVAPGELILLVPHCLQWSECPHRITRHIDNCQRCGRCKIGDLLRWRDEYGFEIHVVTGGTLARRVLKEHRPRAVVAIACERDLVSGLLDVQPLPAQGIINIRPHGPCYNTDVDLNEVEGALKHFIC